MAIMSLIITGCSSDSEEALFPDCPTANTSYSSIVAPLLANYGCVGCHNNNIPSGGIRLDTHAMVAASTNGGRLYGAISHTGNFAKMPQGGSKMSDCDIRKIKAWIDAGAPNN